MPQTEHRKPVIETLINSCALALFTFGTHNIINGGANGYFCITFAVALEWLKYAGRKKELW